MLISLCIIIICVMAEISLITTVKALAYWTLIQLLACLIAMCVEGNPLHAIGAVLTGIMLTALITFINIGTAALVPCGCVYLLVSILIYAIDMNVASGA